MTVKCDSTPFPEIIEVELTRRCNLACSMCQRQVVQSMDRNSDLNAIVLDKVLQECDGNKLQINLGGLGESLLHPELSTLLARIKSHNSDITTGFNTNGLLLRGDVHNWLLDRRCDYLSISLNAPDATSYKWLVGSDAYDRVTSNARAFLKRKGLGRLPLTTVHIFNLPAFSNSTDAFIGEWENIADFVQIRELGNWGGTLDTTLFRVHNSTDGLCQRPWVSLAIDINGGYHRCCSVFALETPEHSVFETPITEYWRGTVMESRREEMAAGFFPSAPPCKKCSGRSIMPNSLIEHNALSNVIVGSSGYDDFIECEN